MAEQENVQQAKDAYAAFGRGDIAAVLQNVADDVEWILPGPADVPTAGTYRGKAAVQTWFGTLAQTVAFERFEPYEFIAQADQVVVLVHVVGRVRQTNRTYTSEDAHLSTYRDGKLIRFQVYTDTAATAAAYQTP
jgi:ketosteroid isomerase-like protein